MSFTTLHLSPAPHRWQMTLVFLALMLGAGALSAQASLPLISGQDAAAGWKFNNGAEFPGASGSVSNDAEITPNGTASLKVVGDFTQGGRYVQIGRDIDKIDIRELSLWVRNPDATRFTLRLIDSSKQVHQIALGTEPGDAWQQLVLPLEDFFAKRGSADAMPGVLKYESWGGAKDGKWHGPAAAIYLLLGRVGNETQVQTLWLNDIRITPPPTAVAGVQQKATIRLDELMDGETDWGFSNGPEFPGATGSLSVQPDSPATGQASLKLQADFTGGGAYVATVKNLAELNEGSVESLQMRIKSGNAPFVGIQLVDETGQTHQRSRTPIKADGQWQELILEPRKIAGGEHWGGAKDGRWHGRPKQLVISIPAKGNPDEKQPSIEITEISANVQLPVFVQPPAFVHSFEETLDWHAEGPVALDRTNARTGRQSLALQRGENDASSPCSATSPAFPVASGLWDIKAALRSSLHSPDNSYHAALELECLDDAGKLVERFPVVEVFGQQDWKEHTRRIEIPAAAVKARFHFQMNKAWGSVWLDDLSAACLAPLPRKDDRIERVLFATSQLGNLLFPEDSRQINITVQTRKPLRDSQRELTCTVRDYWGAEQAAPGLLKLGAATKKDGRFFYETTLDLSGVPLEQGRYYEVHAAIAQEGGEPFRNHTSLAILPEAENKRYKPEDVPFTARNWDNRIPEYIRLTDRLGVRICGVWGGWSHKPPYKPEAPKLDLVRELGMGWLTTTPCKFIEQGKRDYDETALRQGVRNFIAEFGGHRPMIINLGNEPHGTGERVKANVEAYRVVYEEVKKVDPTIPVVATSVEPNEEYFKLGYGQWCDAFDFHIYEGAQNVRSTIARYRELMRQYGVEKPIWSTELGLNSQGMTRHVVAQELHKKFATFFAAGGANVSWFGLLYPDPEGKSHGSSGDSHNVFDCRYNRYCPRLDAVAYYHGVNAIGIKKFVEEKEYAGGIRAFLFRDQDNHTLQVLWKEKGSADVTLPLMDVAEVRAIHIDGGSRKMQPAYGALTLTVNEDPVLLLYDGGGELAAELDPGPITWTAMPEKISRHETSMIEIETTSEEIETWQLLAPALWTVEKIPASEGRLQFKLSPPENTAVREVNLTLQIRDAENRLLGECHRRLPGG